MCCVLCVCVLCFSSWFVVSCSLFVVPCRLFGDACWLLVVRCVLFVACCCLLFVGCSSLSCVLVCVAWWVLFGK